MSWEIVFLLLPSLFIAVGFACSAFASYQYLRFERGADDLSRIPVAIAAFVLQYFFVYAAFVVAGDILTPTILILIAVLSLAVTIRLGITAHSRAGVRMALSGLFTLVGYICVIAATAVYHPFLTFGWP